jgi:hypothetical protein
MSHWHQQARDNSLAKLKEGITRPGEEPQRGGRKAYTNGRGIGAPRTTPAIEGLCGKFEARPKVKGKGKAKKIDLDGEKPRRQSVKTKRGKVIEEGQDEGYGTDEVCLNPCCFLGPKFTS